MDKTNWLQTLKDRLGAFTSTENLKAILGVYTAAAPLKASVDSIKAFTDDPNVTIVATKTIQTELLAITLVAAGAQQKSSVLALTNVKEATIFIDHGRTATTAFVVSGTEYRILASQKAAGDDTWRTLASVVCDITAASEITADADEAPASTRIETGATLPAKGDIVFWENATLANSEWMRVIAIDATGGAEYFDILFGLTNAQAAAKKIYNKGEHFVLSFNVKGFTRLMVVVNNNAGTTNAIVASRIAAITQV